MNTCFRYKIRKSPKYPPLQRCKKNCCCGGHFVYYYRLWKAEKAGAGNMMYQAAEHRQHFQEEKQQEREREFSYRKNFLNRTAMISHCYIKWKEALQCLYAIARNLCIDEYRRPKTEELSEEILLDEENDLVINMGCWIHRNFRNAGMKDLFSLLMSL